MAQELLIKALLVLLFLLFSAADLSAGEMTAWSNRLKAPKLMITGYIEGQYENEYFKIEDSSDDLYRFLEHYNLDVQGYLVHRRLLLYDVTLDWQESQGTDQFTNSLDYKGIALNLSLLPYGPFSAALRASYTDGDGFDYTSTGLSIVYQRRIIPRRLVRQQQREQAPGQEGDNGEGDEAGNEGRKNVRTAPANGQEKSFLYYLLPITYSLDLDRYSYNAWNADNTYYSARLLMKGKYERTQYFITLADYYAKNKKIGTSDNAFFSDFTAVTNWEKSQLYAKGFYHTDTTTDYGLSADLTGLFLKNWDYVLSAYNVVSDYSERLTEYRVRGDVGTRSTMGKTQLHYRFGAGYLRRENSTDSDNASVSASLQTYTSLTPEVLISTSSGVEAGTETSAYAARAVAQYRPMPKLNLYAGYALTGIWGSETFENLPIQGGSGKGPLQTLEAGINYYARVNLASAVRYAFSPHREYGSVSTSASTLLWKVGIHAGAEASKDRDTDNGTSEVTTYGLYGVVTTPFFFRNSVFSLQTTYTKTEEKNFVMRTTETFSTNPTIQWTWRKLIINAEGSYTVNDPSDGLRTTERRIFVRIQRPFRLL